MALDIQLRQASGFNIDLTGVEAYSGSFSASHTSSVSATGKKTGRGTSVITAVATVVVVFFVATTGQAAISNTSSFSASGKHGSSGAFSASHSHTLVISGKKGGRGQPSVSASSSFTGGGVKRSTASVSCAGAVGKIPDKWFGTPLQIATHPDKWMLGFPWGVYSGIFEEYSGSFSVSHSSSFTASGQKGVGSTTSFSCASGFSAVAVSGRHTSASLLSSSSFIVAGSKKAFRSISFPHNHSCLAQGVAKHYSGVSVSSSQQILISGLRRSGSGVSFSPQSSLLFVGKAGRSTSFIISSTPSYSVSGKRSCGGSASFTGLSTFISAVKKSSLSSFVSISGLHNLTVTGSQQESKFGSFGVSANHIFSILGKSGHRKSISLNHSSNLGFSGRAGKISNSLFVSGSTINSYGKKHSENQVSILSDHTTIDFGRKLAFTDFEIDSLHSFHIKYGIDLTVVKFLKDIFIPKIIELKSEISQDKIILDCSVSRKITLSTPTEKIYSLNSGVAYYIFAYYDGKLELRERRNGKFDTSCKGDISIKTE